MFLSFVLSRQRGQTANSSHYRFRFVELVACLIVLISAPVNADGPIRINSYPSATGHDLFASSTAPTPVSVAVSLSGTNITSNHAWPQVFVIRPGATVELGSVGPADPHVGYKFSYHYSYQAGDYRAGDAPDPPCRLPYPDGTAFALGQVAYGPLSSHDDPLMKQAIDIGMPEGTPIPAVRNGVVATVIDTFTAGGWEDYYKDKANQITAFHDDGKVSVYAHLLPHSARVFVGQRVREGEILALSGNTGYSSGPHLHFSMNRPLLGNDGIFRLEAIPVHFYTGNPPRVLVPVAGMRATAVYDRPATVVYRSNTSPQNPQIQEGQNTLKADTPYAHTASTSSVEHELYPTILGFIDQHWLGLAIGISLLWALLQHHRSRTRLKNRIDPHFWK